MIPASPMITDTVGMYVSHNVCIRYSVNGICSVPPATSTELVFFALHIPLVFANYDDTVVTKFKRLSESIAI